MDWQALGVSCRLATLTSVALLLAGLPVAYWFTYSPSRWRVAFDALVTLPLVLPPTVVGFYLLLALAPVGFAFTFGALFVGAFIVNLPIAIQPFTAAIAGVPRGLVETSWCLGWSRWRTFFHVILPLCWRGVLAGVAICFAHTLGEFGVAMMVGGNVAGRTRTVSISIYDQVQSLEIETAHTTALVQIALSLVLLGFVAWLKHSGPFERRIR